MKMTKEEETEFFKDFTALMTKHDKVGYSIYINKYGRGNVDINLYYQRDFVDKTPVTIVSTPDHKIVRGCDGGGYLEVKVHE